MLGDNSARQKSNGDYGDISDHLNYWRVRVVFEVFMLCMMNLVVVEQTTGTYMSSQFSIQVVGILSNVF